MANNKTAEKNKEMCFVIMPFSEPDGYEKGHFRKIYEQLFKPAIDAAGYNAFRVDEDGNSALIQAKIFEHLINAPMVLCDLSTKNPNVLYELGVRHAFDKPVVLVQEEGQTPIFDIAGVTTVSYRKDRLYDEVLEDQQKIKDAISQTVNAERQYSFMKLVNMNPAVNNNSGSVSNEDRMYIMLSEILSRLGTLENSYEKNNVAHSVIYANMNNSILRRKQLATAVERTERVLREIDQGKNEFTKGELLECENELSFAMHAINPSDGVDADMLERARLLRQKIKYNLFRVRAIED